MLRRLLRLLNQDRIRLPRRTIEPRDIQPGDRLQIGNELWRVCQAWPAAGSRGGSFTLAAEQAAMRVALLIAPGVSPGAQPAQWLLVKNEQPLEVPGEMIVVFPSGRGAPYCGERKRP